MKQLLIFSLLMVLALNIDFKPVELKEIQSDSITVTIRGQAEPEGTLRLPMYATVQDALERVVLTPDADISGINPQTILKDRDILVIPRKKEGQVKISINTADADSLCLLPGIGSLTAEKIIAFRNEKGLFQTLEDLMEVPGIGTAKFEKLKDLICL